VVQEVLASGINNSNSNNNTSIRSRNMEEGGPGPDTPHPGHHDTISAVAMSNTCILTGSTDGLIQVWK
jgi:phosphoinositide-3-kinase regulatory subunit 4